MTLATEDAIRSFVAGFLLSRGVPLGASSCLFRPWAYGAMRLDIRIKTDGGVLDGTMISPEPPLDGRRLAEMLDGMLSRAMVARGEGSTR